jgi:hypothetical protein
MRALKALAIVAVFVMLARYFPVIYYSSMFNDFVKQEAVQQNRVPPQLRQALLERANAYFLPVKPDDIEIKEGEGLIRVKVDYRVPVDLFVFKHELSFHASGAGIMPENN